MSLLAEMSICPSQVELISMPRLRAQFLPRQMTDRYTKHSTAKVTKRQMLRLLLILEMLADWGKVDSVCETLWTAAESPEQVIAITMTSAAGAQFVFNVLPEFPSAGGAGTDAQTVSFSFKVEQGTVTETFS
jgi:hypothetical protein